MVVGLAFEEFGMVYGVSWAFFFFFLTCPFIVSGCVRVCDDKTRHAGWGCEIAIYIACPSMRDWILRHGDVCWVLDEEAVAIPREIAERGGGHLWERGRGPTDLSVSASVHRRDDAIYGTVRQLLVSALRVVLPASSLLSLSLAWIYHTSHLSTTTTSRFNHSP